MHATAQSRPHSTMKVIDMDQMEMVFAGEPWTHKLMPCSKQAIPLLERNEKIVSWVRPKGGDVTIPAIRYKDKFFTLSLRMQKAIYRHIRLKKGFKNEEVMDGVVKLRIPDVLLKEKIRTQSRFDVRRPLPHHPLSTYMPSDLFLCTLFAGHAQGHQPQQTGPAPARH